MLGLLVIHRVAHDRAGHAVPAATAAAEFGAGARAHLDAFLAQQRIGVGVEVIGEDDARRGANQVGAAVPLGAFAHVVVAAGLDDAHFPEAQRVAHSVDKAALVLVQLNATLAVGAIGEGL